MTTYFVNTDSTGGDGTTNNTSGATAAYATQVAFDAARAADITGGSSVVCKCTGNTVKDGKVNYASDWVTDSTHTLTVEANAGQEATPAWDTSRYRISDSGGYDSVIENTGVDYFTLKSLQIENTGTALSADGIEMSNAGMTNASELIVDSCFVRKVGSSGSSNGIDMAVPSSGTTSRVRTIVNCIVKGPFVSNINFNIPNASNTVFNIYANTILDATTNGINSVSNGTATANVKNNLVDGSGTADYTNTAAYDTTGGNCSGDATSPESSLRSKTFTFVDAANDDHHLASGDSGASGNGVDISSFSSVDMEGVTRIAFDSGADEKTVAAGGTIRRNPFTGPFARPFAGPFG